MHFTPGRRVPVAALALASSLAVAVTPASAKPASAKGRGGKNRVGHTLYVARKGSDTGSCTPQKPCATINGAIVKARPGSTVVVARGVYKESVVVKKRIHLAGLRGAVIDATGLTNGVVLSGPGAAGSSIRGFVVENALQEGILAVQTSHVRILDNVVRHNDTSPPTTTGECAAQGQVPGDCGEGLHLMTVAYSLVKGNLVEGNSGGILSTDELGPTHNNVISFNRVLNNVYDCGITNASHSSTAYVNGELQKSKGGIYNEMISHNVSNGNGVKGQGAGILMAAAGPGGAVYDNTVVDNVANRNGQGGFVLHSHAPSQYLNGNKIIGNTFVGDGTTGDATTGITRTTGIILFSGVVPITKITVKGNTLKNEYYGIWEHNAPAIRKSANRFSHVTIDVEQA